MILLILTVCTLAQPERCAETRLPLADVGLIACMTSAQPTVAQWLDGHPGRRVARWRCAYPEREGAPI